MIFNINEENQDIDDIISYLESLVIKLRKSNKLDNNTINIIQSLFDDEIKYYMDNYYLPGIEIDPKYEEQITNELLDLISILKKIF